MLSSGFPALHLADPDIHRWVKGEERRAVQQWGRLVCAVDKTGGDDTCTMCSFSKIQNPTSTFPPINMTCNNPGTVRRTNQESCHKKCAQVCIGLSEDPIQILKPGISSHTYDKQHNDHFKINLITVK